MEHFDIQNLTFSHAAAKGKLSLDGVSLRIRAGEFLVLCGRSGSGKTKLLRHLKTVLTKPIFAACSRRYPSATRPRRSAS